jgi:hypothetical protein
MSLQRSRTANMPGFGEPTYPRLVTELAAVLANGVPLGAIVIERAARQVPGFNASIQAVTTADAYVWLRVLEFRLPGGRRSSVAIAIPHARDYSRADGSQLDRSPAVYLRHGAGNDDANAILGLLIADL